MSAFCDDGQPCFGPPRCDAGGCARRREAQFAGRSHEWVAVIKHVPSVGFVPVTRAEWVTCIRRNDVQTWCSNSALTFTFMSAEHAIGNHANAGRLTTCPECARAASEALLASVEPP